MKMDPFKKDHYLRSKLDEYHVEVPDFPMKPKAKRWERFINLLASPAKNPLEPLITTANGSALVIVPIAGTAAITLIQILFFL
ncbi:hypothetical protein [Neobacillus mesonae]|uniref:hypothetical protein n=1 Tax=Neobacillus mesonae TaxID=1193713 RepID=UPI00203FC5AC|nr:hypothetical protein [Neobacillus mesonae]MCM3570678.1 hypothetical protein [Neobacillus mesonae]